MVKPKIRKPEPEYSDESVPAHPGMDSGYPVVVFRDHSFCAGGSMVVHKMRGPHMHSQIELNFVREGHMTYWFDGRQLTLESGKLALFWGMIPHQVIDCAPGTEFVVLYAPMSVFLELPALSRLRQAIFAGAMVEAKEVKPYDRDIFARWREDLLSGDMQLQQIVHDELTARIRRVDRDGWLDIRSAPNTSNTFSASHDHDRVLKVEQMARFIGEKALENISTEDVAKAAGLHPNYAMTLFKRAVGTTIKQSINRHRIDTARSMLIATDRSIATIAFTCGFGSLSSFYAAFEQRFKLSPAAFRRSNYPRNLGTAQSALPR